MEPDLKMFILYLLKDRYKAMKEMDTRLSGSDLSPERYEYLIYQETLDADKASREKAKYILEMTRE